MTKKQNEDTAFSLGTAEAVTRSDLAEAKDVRTELLVDFAAGKDVQDKLDGIDEEIEQHERALKRFAEARAAQAQVGNASARETQHTKNIQILNDALVGAKELTEQCKNALLVLAELKGCLEQIDGQRSAVADALRDAARDASRGVNERVVENVYEQLRDVLHSLTLSNAFVMAIWDSGLTRRGVQLSEDFVQVRRPPIDTHSDPTADASNALAQVRALAKTVAEWSANANGIEQAVAA